MTTNLVKKLLVIVLFTIINSEIIPIMQKQLSLNQIKTKMNDFQNKSQNLYNRIPVIPNTKQSINSSKLKAKSDIKSPQLQIQSSSGSTLDDGYTFNESLIFGSNSEVPVGSQQDKGQYSYINSGSSSLVGETFGNDDIFGKQVNQNIFQTDPKGQTNQKIGQVTIQQLKLYLALRGKIMRAGIFKLIYQLNNY